MPRRQIGTVAGLGRYPVKSMLGEQLAEAEITERGLVGDRAWALRELATGRIVSAKKFPRIFEFRAAYDWPPSRDDLAPITIRLPDGERIHADDPKASDTITKALGREVRIERPDRSKHERAGIDPATVFADVPVEKVLAQFTAENMPPEFALSAGTFFDDTPMHVIATGTLKHLATLAPGSIFDPRRFRPSIVVDTGADASGFVEDGWLGGALEIGTVRIAAMKPALRCAMTTHRQGDLPRDNAILRTAATHHRATVGVFATIESPGRVRLGDPVYLDS